MKKVCEATNYCIVIPFANKGDFRDAIDMFKSTRPKMQEGYKKKWWVDGMIIDKEDYERLLKKSKSIEIINELEYEDGEE